MGAAGWLLNLGFAGGSATAWAEPDGPVRRLETPPIPPRMAPAHLPGERPLGPYAPALALEANVKRLFEFLAHKAVSGPSTPGGPSVSATGTGTPGRDTPIGSIIAWTGLEPGIPVPGGFLVCDGREVLRAQYPGLFRVIGTAFGLGDGSLTFNLPDLRARVPTGQWTRYETGLDEED